jgi:hypothetical protein
MALATNNAELRLNVPSNFTTEDRIVSRSQHNALYVPQIFLPNELIATVSSTSFDARMKYFLDEVVKEHVNPSLDVIIEKGVNTGRIFAITAKLEKPSFTVLLNRMANVGSALKIEIKNSMSDVQRQNYRLILSLINKTVSRITQNRKELEEDIFHQPT